MHLSAGTKISPEIWGDMQPIRISDCNRAVSIRTACVGRRCTREAQKIGERGITVCEQCLRERICGPYARPLQGVAAWAVENNIDHKFGALPKQHVPAVPCVPRCWINSALLPLTISCFMLDWFYGTATPHAFLVSPHVWRHTLIGSFCRWSYSCLIDLYHGCAYTRRGAHA